jgi:predicted phage terminase large subunit-like protein
MRLRRELLRRESCWTYPSPLELGRAIDRRVVRTPALLRVDQALVDLAERKGRRRLIVTVGPQEGKSMTVARWFPHWLLQRQPDTRIALTSYAHSLARRSGRAVRNDIIDHPNMGIALRDDSAAQHEWQLDGHDGGMITVGIGGGLAGRPVDCLIIDDPLADQRQADSETYREMNWSWWETVGSARLSPDAIVVVIMTRWHAEDLVGQLLATDRDAWRYINIPAQAEEDPDILGRRVGEFMVSARGRTAAEWEQRKRDAGSRGWQALYQGHPSALEGNIFKREWWKIQPIRHALRMSNGAMQAIGCDTVIISVDATFKDSKASDYVVMQVWGRRGSTCYLLDQVRDRMDFPATCAALTNLAARWPQASAKIIEDKANGPAIIAQLRTKVPGLVPFTPVDSKEARANAVAAFVEAGNVEVPDPQLSPWVGDFIEECAGFPNAAHDDQVDAMTQALHRLLIGGGGLAGYVGASRAERR